MNHKDMKSDPEWFHFLGLLLARQPGGRAVLSRQEVDKFDALHHGDTIVLRATNDHISLELMPSDKAAQIEDEYNLAQNKKAIRKVN